MAVILIATVIVTYSTIRNSPIMDQPTIQSAIDETNFAIKQILGFTVGYYGSVLQVTGNSSYAKGLSIEYLRSGLENVAKMHPQWGTSFSDNNSTQLHSYWFTNTSSSSGSLTVTYNLTGLGISGMNYTTSCKLTAEVLNNTESQACVKISRDETEPLINLGKSSFKFYRYNTTTSMWEKVNPTAEPIAYANGTYQIPFPSGIDQYSYVVEVQDARGIVVVASSFSQYVINFEWNAPPQAKYAVSGSAPAITGAPDKNYLTVGKAATCEVTDYQGGNGVIRQVFFNITYYGTVSGTLAWAYRLDGGAWTPIGNLQEGGTVNSPLTVTLNATALRTTWTWANLNNTDIQFQNNDAGETENAYVDAIYATIIAENMQNDAAVIELLQNGTMRWLGQSLVMKTQTKPIPPIPTKSIHVNQTANGVNSEVPFQIENWASGYQIPLGLADNASVFTGRNMLVFLTTPRVSQVTIWWNGSDVAQQTPLAYTNQYFADNPSTSIGTLKNQNLTLTVDASSGKFEVRSTSGTAENLARFMRVNGEWSIYGSDPAYVIYNGTVRDIIQIEPEWSTGANNCPNMYAHIVLTLPANATYYTYQLRFMFVNSLQNRVITDLCPIRLSSLTGTAQTENGTLNGYPIVTNGTGTYYNYSASIWAHHWCQFISGVKGAGLLFADGANEQLYIFDSIAGSKTGAIAVDSGLRTIELSPVKMASTSFTNALDVTWHGAVATFDGTTPLYQGSSSPLGLWMLVEYPPIILVSTLG